MARPISIRRHCKGTTAVEFAIVSSVFFMMLIGIIQIGILLFFYNTAEEATRLGARIAAVCDLNAAAITNNMTALLPDLAAGDVSVSYQPAGCTVANCQSVTVEINPGFVVPVAIPFVTLPTLFLPAASTTLARESLQSSFAGTANPMCQ
jgi:Flp pilus assembly protein TadG